MAVTQGIRFLHRFSLGEYDTTFPGANVISVTSTASGDFDKKNLTTTPLREVWRSATAATTQEIVIQANDPSIVIDTFALLNHNLTDLAVVTLEANFTNNFAAPPLSINLSWNAKHMVLVQSLGVAYEYFKIKIVDPTNPCGYLSIGRIIAGESFTMSDNEDITDDIKNGRDDLAYKMKTEGFFRASNERVKVRKLGIRFSKLRTMPGEDDNFLNLQDLFENVGETYPFLTVVDPNDPYFIVMWGQIDSLPADDFDINRYVNFSFQIQEVY